MQGWGDNKGGSENNIHYPAGGRTELALSPRRRSWTGMTAKRGRRRERRKLARGNEERDGIAGRAKASGIKLKENGVCSPLFFGS